MVDIEPLKATLWIAAVGKLHQRADRAKNHELESLLRHAYHLVQLTPRHLRSVVRAQVGEGAFEDLLEKRHFEAAARALLGVPGTVSVSQADGNLSEARVCLAAGLDAVAKAAKPESAILLAWTKCLLALDNRVTTQQIGSPHRVQHREQSVRHLRLIER